MKFVNDFLRSFSYVTKILSSEKTSTLPVVVVAVNTLLDKIENILTDIAENCAGSTSQLVLVDGLQDCRNKILKHYDKSN